MAKKDYTEYRKQQLEKKGFLPFEAEFYSRFKLSMPGHKRVIRFREKEIANAMKAGIPKKDIPNYILASYRAKGYLDAKGKPSPDIYNSTLFEELEKPSKQRKSLFIQADRYKLYNRVVKNRKFSVSEARQFAEAIPPEKYAERVQQYRLLRRNYYSHFEALYIVSAQTAPDKNGKTRLQKLDLTQDVWQTAIKERVNWIRSRVRLGTAQGKTKEQVLRAIKKEIQDWYDKDKKRTPFDEIEEMYPQSRPPRVDVDVKQTLRNTRAARAKKQREEKAPWRTRR